VYGGATYDFTKMICLIAIALIQKSTISLHGLLYYYAVCNMTSQTAPDWQLQIGESGASSRYNFNLELERLVCKQTALAA
jgi:hypothetical protein